MMNQYKKKRYEKKVKGSRVLKNKSGIILFVVLWTLVILTSLAVGIGRHTRVELALAKHALGQARAKYLAVAGINYARDLVLKDSRDRESSSLDTIFYCGIPMKEETDPTTIFQEQSLGKGYFSIFYPSEEDGVVEDIYAIQDEQSKIDINALDSGSIKIFIELCLLLDIDEDTAKTIAYSLLDWKDSDSFLGDPSFGAEDFFYEGEGYTCKNLPFDSKEELLLVRGMNKDIFDKIKKYITIFPKEVVSRQFINFETAPLIVLQAMARAYSGSMKNTSESDADSLARKIISWRKGEDGVIFTKDDRVVDPSGLGLLASERAIFLNMQTHRLKKSHFFNIHVKGHDDIYHVDSEIEAIIARENSQIVFWKVIR